MALEITTEVPRIVQRCTELVGTDPVAHTIFATIAAWVQRADAAGWAAWPDDDSLVLAARSQAHTRR